MIVPGLFNGYYQLSEGGTGVFLSTLGFPIPALFAWAMILSQLIFGVSVLIGWKLKYTTLPLALILVVAAITVWWGNWSQVLLHFTVASNYIVFSLMDW